MADEKKKRVYVCKSNCTDVPVEIICNELCYIPLWIESELDAPNLPDDIELTISIKYMTEEQLKELPDYDG